MTMHGIILPLVLLYFATVAVVVLRILQRRRASMRLLWPPSITQRQMEHQGARFLERMGWQVSVAISLASHSVFQCFKPGDEMFVLFMRDGAMFRRMLMTLSKYGPHMMRILVVVPYDPPPEAMIKEADEIGAAVVHFRQMTLFTGRESARQPSVEAAREMKQRVQAIRTS